MADEEDMFIDDEYDIEISSTDSELELLNCGQLTDTIDGSDKSRSTLSNFSISEFSEPVFDDSNIDFPFYSTNVISEGRRLYLMYLQNEILKTRINLPGYLIRASKLTDCTMCENILSFHKLLIRFEISAQRKWVKGQAQDVVFQGLTFKQYTNKLKKLFEVIISFNVKIVTQYF